MPRGNGGIIGPNNSSFSGVWSLLEAQLRCSGNTWPNIYSSSLIESATGADVVSASSGDPYFAYTTLLLPGNGTNGAQNNTFLDSSTNNFTITRNGNATQGTFSPFSQTGWSNYFNGSNAYLSYTQAGSTYPAQLSFLNGASANGTIECWVYPFTSSQGTNRAENPAIIAVGDTYFSLNVTTTNKARFYWYTTDENTLDSTGSVPFHTWTHIAAVRNGATVTLFINGISSGSISYTGWNWASASNGSQLKIGYHAPWSTARYFNGYISNLRVVNGTALYTANFTPSTTSLTAITNTSLLICANNRFIDTSTINTALTVSGTPSVVAFSPFAPTAVYSPAVHRGSAYFDGSGDYLTVPDNAAFQLGTNSFCIEGWFFPTTTGDGALISKWATTAATAAWNIVRISGTLYCQVAYGSSVINATTTGWPLNQWSHIAFVRSGNTLSAYLNGTRFYTNASFSNTINVGVNGVTVGTQSGGTSYPFNGYLSGFRVVNGSAVYDPSSSTITVPTAPLTAITNTSLLLNFTNAGIYDATSKNDLETVGNAQISTAQYQFAPSSMAFDGNGDYLIMPDAQTGQFLTGDFTVEYWCRFGSQGTNYAPQVGTLTSASPSGTWRFGTFTNNGGVYLAYYNGYDYVNVQFGSTAYNDNTWRHFALTRSGTTVRAFVNGTQVGTNQTVSQNFNSSNRVCIGAELITPTYFTGYIQDLRITKGHARYTANFTPPTAAFPTL